MLYLILSIICSVTVGIIFKSVRASNVNIPQIITWNYVLALLLCLTFFRPHITVIPADAPWAIYIILSVLLPSIFLFLVLSIRYTGIVKTDAAQRLSLVIPIIAAYFLFKENFNTLKFIGLIIGFPAIWLIMKKKDEESASRRWIYPIIVLAGFGVVDVLFKKVAVYTAVPYTTSLSLVFGGALIIAAGYTVYESIAKKEKFTLVNLGLGALVGLFNFGNILYYLKAHQAFANNPSTVFAIMNIGVIVLGSFAGLYFFKEKLSILNFAGILMAISAIIFITLSQAYI